MEEITTTEPELMLRIVNTQPRLLVPPPVTYADGTKFGITLPPGGTDVPARYLAALDALNPLKGAGKVWRSWQALGYIKLDETASLGVESPATLAGYSQVGALALVAVETSTATLEKWAAVETGEVRAACTARLAALATAARGNS